VRALDWRVDAVVASSGTPKQGSAAHVSIPGASDPVPLVHMRFSTSHAIGSAPPAPPADRAVLAASPAATRNQAGASTAGDLEREQREAASISGSGLRALAAGVLSGADGSSSGGTLREAGATAAAGGTAPAVEFEGCRLPATSARVVSLTMDAAKFRALHGELKRALAVLQSLDDGVEEGAAGSGSGRMRDPSSGAGAVASMQ